jgi:hypothetical protein
MLISVLVAACAEVPTPVFELLPGGGLRVTVADQPGQSEVDLHFNLNVPLPGVTAGEYNVIMTEATDGAWVHEDATIPAKAGDTVYFWVLVIVNGEGFQVAHQQH